MRRQNQGARRAEFEPTGDGDAPDFEAVNLLDQRRKMDHDPIADNAGHAGMQNARRDQVQNRLLTIDNQGVAGVVAALKAHHSLCLLSQQVHDLALAFVTPLSADDHYALAHDQVPLRTNTSNTTPASMLASPKMRSCRAGSPAIKLMLRRQPSGLRKGRMPSSTK